MVRAGLVYGDQVALGRDGSAQPDKTRISCSVRHARAFGVVLSVLGPGIQDLLALMDSGLVWRSRDGPVEHSGNMGLVAGTGANAAACRGMYEVEVVEL